ncbi:hypothetical protein CPB85DRAFT_1271809, partial [Mucidula mucida]
MSEFDKLHKLYGTSFLVPLTVLVRAEVLNEFNTLKAAIMLNAGSQPSKNTDMRATVFGLAGSAFEAASGVQKLAHMATGAMYML